jgi:multiple sugar transport system permease protein
MSDSAAQTGSSENTLPATLASASKRALAAAAILLVVWSFARVGVREWNRGALPDGEIEIVVMHWSGDAGQQEDAIVEASLARFEALHPGIRVRRINPGDAGSYYNKLQTMMSAGAPPDVFYVGYERLASFADAGLLASLEPYLDEPGLDGLAGDFDIRLEDFYTATVDSYRFDGERVGEGPLYGIPKDFTPSGFYVNRTLLAEAGVEVPGSDWTWADFERVTRAVGALPDCHGAEFVTWPFALRAYLWTEGGDTVLDDFSGLRLREPEVAAALERLRGWRFDEERTLRRTEAGQASGSSVFLTGKVGLAGPFGRWVVPSYRDIPAVEDGGFEWDFLPLPRGAEQANVVLSVAWGIAERCRHKEAAWKLVQFLSSEEVQAEQSELGLAIPSRIAVAESPAFIDPEVAPFNDRGYLEAAEIASVMRWPANPKFEELQRVRLDEALQSGTTDLESAVQGFEDAWSAEVSSPLARGDFATMPWGTIRAVSWVLAALVLGLFVRTFLRAPSSLAKRIEERQGWMLVSPWMIGFAVFMAVPVGLSLLLSFTRWKGLGPLSTAEFVGFGNYLQLIQFDERFHTSLRVTLYYALLAVPGGQLVALGLAALLHSKLRGIPFFRAAWYLPSVLAGVGVAILWRWVFDSDGGLLNALLEPLLSPFGLTPPEWFGADAALFGPPAFVLMSFWMTGGAMLIYLAGLQGVPEELKEAAAIDGAGAWTRFRSVTLPMLSPVILFNGIMAIIGSFQVFTQAFVMTGGQPGDKTRFYVLYLYNQAFEFYEMGYASALAWILLVIVLGLTLLVMRSSAKHVYYEALR